MHENISDVRGDTSQLSQTSNFHKPCVFKDGKDLKRSIKKVNLAKSVLLREHDAVREIVCLLFTNAGPTVSVHAESLAALAVVRAPSVDTGLLASSVELLTLIYI